MAKKASKKILRKSVKTTRKSKKAAPRKKTLDLKKVQADMKRAMAAMQRRGAPESANLQQAIDDISRFCTDEQGCGATMIITL
jgi:hypothetical protein